MSHHQESDFIWDAVYIIRGSYLTFLRWYVHSDICVVYVLVSNSQQCVLILASVFIKSLDYCSTLHWLHHCLLLPGVSAGGRASAAAGPAPQQSSQTHRRSAAEVQSPAGEEAVCEDEGSSSLHPGIIMGFWVYAVIQIQAVQVGTIDSTSVM